MEGFYAAITRFSETNPTIQGEAHCFSSLLVLHRHWCPSHVSGAFVMPNKLSHSPHYACANYPVCTQKRFRHRDSSGALLRDAYCSSCLRLPQCSQTDCLHRILPPHVGSESRCLYHVTNAPDFFRVTWPLCSNSAQWHCRRLSVAASGGFCHACQQNALPCCNALHGWREHVPDNAHGAKSCATLHGRKKVPCPKQLPDCNRCAAHPVRSPTEQLCDLCFNGCVCV